MVESGPRIETESDASDEEESAGIDLDHLRELLGFVIDATRRRIKLAAPTFMGVAALGIFVAAVMPRTYNSQVKLLAQRSSAIHLLTSPVQGMDSVDNPTKNVASMIMRRDNLIALVKEVNLLERFEETRSPIFRLKDRIMSRFRGSASAEDMQLGLVRTLESKLDVVTDEPTSTVTISVDWSDPQLAYDLVTHVSKNFLEARYDSDVAMITDSIAVLEEHAKNQLDDVDSVLESYQKVLSDRLARPAESARPIVHPPPSSARTATLAPIVPVAPDPEQTKALEETRLRIRALEESQGRTLDTLKQQLMQAQLTLTPRHPTVIALQQQVDEMSQPAPELVQLRAEERSLMAQLAAPAASAMATAIASAPVIRQHTPVDGDETSDAGSTVPEALTIPAPVLESRDGPLQLAQSKLASVIRAYQDANARVDAAKIELDVTRAAYKHEYTVVTPAELPKGPKKPTAQLIGFGSVIGAALLAIAVAVVAELLSGLIMQPWQVRRQLKLDVIGELDSPS